MAALSIVYGITNYLLTGGNHIVSTATSSTAQGGGGSFEDRKPRGSNVAVNDRSQSKPTRGPTNGWRQRDVVEVVVVIVMEM